MTVTNKGVNQNETTLTGGWHQDVRAVRLRVHRASLPDLCVQLAATMTRQIVCVRMRWWMPGSFDVSIGKPGMVDPKTGNAFRDEPYMQWETSQPCCDSCGELLGTYRARHYRRRFVATIDAHKCTDCGKQVCTECVKWWQTSEVIGSHKRTTEGGNRYDVPTYRSDPLCVDCCNKRAAERTQQPKPRTIVDALRELGLEVE